MMQTWTSWRIFSRRLEFEEQTPLPRGRFRVGRSWHFHMAFDLIYPTKVTYLVCDHIDSMSPGRLNQIHLPQLVDTMLPSLEIPGFQAKGSGCTSWAARVATTRSCIAI